MLLANVRGGINSSQRILISRERLNIDLTR
jgi:hypothetical protein